MENVVFQRGFTKRANVELLQALVVTAWFVYIQFLMFISNFRSFIYLLIDLLGNYFRDEFSSLPGLVVWFSW